MGFDESASGNGNHQRKGNGGGFKMRLFKIFFFISKDRNTSKATAVTLMAIMFTQIFDLLISPIM